MVLTETICVKYTSLAFIHLNISLLEWQSYRERKEEIICWIIPQWHDFSQDWAWRKPGIRSLLWVPHVTDRGSSLWAILYCLLRLLARSWILNGLARIQAAASSRCQYYRKHLNVLCHNTWSSVFKLIIQFV